MESRLNGRQRGRSSQVSLKRGRQSEPESSNATREAEGRSRRSAGAALVIAPETAPQKKKSTNESHKVHNTRTVEMDRRWTKSPTLSNSSQDSTAIPPSDQTHRSAFFKKESKRRRYFKGMTYSLGSRKRRNRTKTKVKSESGSCSIPADLVEGESTQESFMEGDSEMGIGAETSCDSKDLMRMDDDMENHESEGDEEILGEDVEPQVVEVGDDEEDEEDEVKLEIPDDFQGMELDATDSEMRASALGSLPEQNQPLEDEVSVVVRKYDEPDTTTTSSMPVLRESSGMSRNSSLSNGNSILSSVKTRNRIKRRYDENLVDIDDPTFVEAANELSSTNLMMDDAMKTTRLSQANPTESSLIPYYRHEASIVPSNYRIEHIIDKAVPIFQCHCLSLPLSHAPPKTAGNEFFCQALDGIAGRIMGCSKKIKNFDMYRSSQKTPYSVLCEGHILRLLSHQCCPTCGIFCTQGDFMLCKTGQGSKIQRHFYHKDCAYRPVALETVGCVTDLCPHCGESNSLRAIKLELESDSSPIVSFSQKISSTGPRAKISLGSVRTSNDGIDPPSRTLPGMKEPGEIVGEDVDIVVNEKTLLTCNTAWCPNVTKVARAAQSFHKGLAPRVNAKSLYSAAKAGDVERVIFAIMSGVDLCTVFTEEDNYTALHVAAENGHVDICHLLVCAGCPVDSLETGLYTAFMTAIAAEQQKTARCLMALGTDTSKCGEDGMTCLHLASKAGLLEIVQIILKISASQVNAQDEGGWTPIVWASEHQHSNVVLLLLKYGANPNIKDAEGNTALHWSAYSGTVDISLMYIDLGLDINVRNELGDTPLHVAARQDKYEMVMLLLGREADVTAVNEAGQRAIDVVKEKNSSCYFAIYLSIEVKRAIKNSNRVRPMPRIIHKDISRGKERHAIRVINEVDDDRTIPHDFMYLTNNCETTLLNIDTTIQSLQSCKCQDDCTSTPCQCTHLGSGCWYRDNRLVEHFNFKDPPIIFECNRACACFTTCQNRVLQNGIKVHLELFKTQLTGWGVRALQDIPKGSFVCEYVGEIITDREADQREDDSYLFDLENRDGDTFCLDARHYGNISRFINHCCDSNLHPVRVYVDHHDLRFPRIALFAKRDISSGEQLGFDYGEKFWVIKYKSFLCGCGSSKCKYNADNIQSALEAYHNRSATDDDSIINGE